MNVPDKPTMSLYEAAAIFGISKTHAYRLAADDALPFPIIRLGKRIVVPTEPIRQMLCVSPAERNQP